MITCSGGSAQAPTGDVTEWAEEFLGMESTKQR